MAPITTTRGCPYSCTYCHDLFQKRFRVRSAKHLVDELEVLHDLGVLDLCKLELNTLGDTTSRGNYRDALVTYFSDQPGAQFYTGNIMSDKYEGKKNRIYVDKQTYKT